MPVSTLDKNEKPVVSTAFYADTLAAWYRWGVTYTFNDTTKLFELDGSQKASTPTPGIEDETK